MNKKHRLFFGFVFLLMTTIIFFSGCDKKDTVNVQPDPYAWITNPANDNWISNSNVSQRLIINYRNNMQVFEQTGQYVNVRRERRTSATTFSTAVFKDNVDPTRKEHASQQTAWQTGASTNDSTTDLVDFMGDGETTDGLYGIPQAFRQILLYAVAPHWYKHHEGFKIQKEGKKLTFFWTHNGTSRMLWTNENGEIDINDCAKQINTCLQLSEGARDDFLAELDLVQKEWFFPFEGYRPYVVMDGTGSVSDGGGGLIVKNNPDVLTRWNGGNTSFLLPGAPTRHKQYLNWDVIQASSGFADERLSYRSGKRYTGRVLAEYNEETGVLTVNADLLLVPNTN